MKILFKPLVIALCLATQVQAEEDLNKMLAQAKKLLASGEINNDKSAGKRLLNAILEKDPEHPQALWELTFTHYISPIANYNQLQFRAHSLAAAGKHIETIVASARRRNQQAFSHFVLAAYSSFYKAYDRALKEIDNALAIQPDSIKYMHHKGRLVASKGRWEQQDSEILQGMAIIEQAHEKNHPDSDFSITDADYYFQLAIFNSALTVPRHEKTIEYYLAAIENNKDDDRQLAFAWNNISMAYRDLEQCDRAKHAAEQALAIMDFGAARNNRQYAEYCLEMGSLAETLNDSTL